MTNWAIYGQQYVVDALDKSLRQGQLSHAYLLVGPKQIGKGTLARQLAQAVNCVSDNPPCGTCLQCQRIRDGKHADVQIISASTDGGGKLRAEISIDQIRSLEKTIVLTPYEGSSRVFVIDEAEHLSIEAANALLKTLEEPPEQVLILLLTAREEEILPTVRSRCQRIELIPLPQDMMSNLLTTEHGVSTEDAQLLARLSKGRYGWAVMAATDPAVMERRHAHLQNLIRILDGGMEERFKYSEEMAIKFNRDRESVQEILTLWVEWLRDLLMIKEKLPQLVINQDWDRFLEECDGKFTKHKIMTAIYELVATQERLMQNANPRISLDVLMLELPR